MSKKVLIAGESWFSTTVHTKGFDSFTTSTYEEGVRWLKNSLEAGGWQVHYMPSHVAATDFPQTLDQLSQYDAVLLSDIGSNTLLLHPSTFLQGQRMPNRCELLRDYVLQGGGLCMVGGYMTFAGIDGKGRWGQTAVQEVLPVALQAADDRQEIPQGVPPVLLQEDHPVFQGIPAQWPAFLGYNRTKPLADNTQLLATINGDPFIALGQFGKGKSAVFTSDCAPHWAPTAFCEWEHYGTFWCNLLSAITSG